MAIDETTALEATERRQRLHEVVRDKLDPAVAGEALACRLQHDVGEVEADAAQLLAIDLQKGKQAAVARAQVKDAASITRHLLEQHALAFRASRELVGPKQVAMNTLGVDHSSPGMPLIITPPLVARIERMDA